MHVTTPLPNKVTCFILVTGDPLVLAECENPPCYVLMEVEFTSSSFRGQERRVCPPTMPSGMLRCPPIRSTHAADLIRARCPGALRGFRPLMPPGASNPLHLGTIAAVARCCGHRAPCLGRVISPSCQSWDPHGCGSCGCWNRGDMGSTCGVNLLVHVFSDVLMHGRLGAVMLTSRSTEPPITGSRATVAAQA